MDYGLASATADGQNPAPLGYEQNPGFMTARDNISFIQSGAGFCPSTVLNDQGQGSVFWKPLDGILSMFDSQRKKQLGFVNL